MPILKRYAVILKERAESQAVAGADRVAFIAAVQGTPWPSLAENSSKFLEDVAPIMHTYADLKRYQEAERIIFEIADVLGDRSRFSKILKDKAWFHYMVPTLRKYAKAKGYKLAEKNIIFKMADLYGESFVSELKERTWPSYEASLEERLPALTLRTDTFVHDISLIDWNQLVRCHEDFKQRLLPYMRKLRSSGVDHFELAIRKIRKALVLWNPKKRDECRKLCNDIVQKVSDTFLVDEKSETVPEDLGRSRQFASQVLPPTS